MKRALFNLMAGLLILSLAGCMFSLFAAPIPLPTFPSLPSPTPLAAIPTPFSTPTETAQPTDTPTVEPTKTPEQLGGSEVAVFADLMHATMPDAVKALLTASSPETWNQTGWVFADGTPYPWGKPIFVEGTGRTTILNIPALVKGIVRVPEPAMGPNAKRIYVVLEVPAFGGSNFS